ncbi:DUF5701 family protein [Dietzia sp. CW19]|uniref:DUF5701 family protein n=1 Tax=Dietzia sp. CW19 TaxID=1630634 RepID=UPI0032209036
MSAQADRLVELGVPELGGITAGRLREHAAALEDAALEDAVLDGAARAAAPGPGRPVLAVHPSFVSTARLATLLRRGGRAGFVVVDMSDLAEFTPTDDVRVPDAPLYLVRDVTRDDDMLGWTPTDAHAELARRGRTPLTISEGVSWLLQQPEMLEPGRCFMCIGSRKRKADGALDARTPALWISGGTGRDGRENKGAPKVGWCWANNHHTWLGFASTAGRVGRDSAQSPATET